MIHFDCDTKFSAKAKSLIAYLSGYVFGAFYHRISILSISLPEYRHVIVLNRGGLWKVNEDVIAIFSVAEAYFLSST